jgi:hypothetical protein
MTRGFGCSCVAPPKLGLGAPGSRTLFERRDRLLDGTPHHRDLFLNDEEHAANDCMTVCCSRSKSALLVLDL